MRRVASATEARVHFGELMRQVVEEKTSVVVERGGKPQVVIISISEYEQLLAEARSKPEEWQRLLREAHELIIAETGGGPLVPSVDDVIRDMREERDAELRGGLY
jgi:prevent-host-death family protein